MIDIETPPKTPTPSRRSMLVPALALFALAAGCAPPEDELPERKDQALNGSLSSKSNLSRKTITTADEFERRKDTDLYHREVGLDPNGGYTSGTIAPFMTSFTSFKNRYGFPTGEVKAFYYNRGDLGIGREMHCVDHSSSDGQIACYVKNFFAGDGNTEFGFGLSPNIAFDNMNAGNAFATVAMVYRRDASPQDKVYFVVYDAQGSIASNAALDRHGLNYALELKQHPGTLDPALFGTPGVHFNNHIPSNCTNCHGGKYDPATHSVTGALFLPFDLDQFEYQEVPGKTRADQLTAFARLNEMVRKVAAGSDAGQLVDQIDGWYGNLSARSSVLTQPFNASYLPAGWAGTSAGTALYRSVIRPYCRNCHVANYPYFNTETEFKPKATTALVDVCTWQMPHALQTVREFWLSSGWEAFESWYRTNGYDTSFVQPCGPGSFVTLDPQLIASTRAPF
jgi:hypothetical protein